MTDRRDFSLVFAWDPQPEQCIFLVVGACLRDVDGVSFGFGFLKAVFSKVLICELCRGSDKTL